MTPAVMVSRALFSLVLLAALPLLGAESSPPAEEASVDYYLKIEGIDGEADDGSIAVAGFAWDLTAEVGRFAEFAPSGAARMDLRVRGQAGRLTHPPITFVKQVDKGSPLLMKAAAERQPLAVDLWKSENGEITGKLTLENAIISSYRITSTDSTPPTESISFTYEGVGMTGPPASAEGTTKSSKSNSSE